MYSMRRRSILASGLLVTAVSTSAFAETNLNEIRDAMNGACKSWLAGDAGPNGDMKMFRDDPNLVVFDFSPPAIKGYKQLRDDNMNVAKPLICEFTEIHPFMLGTNYAYSYAFLKVSGQLKTGQTLSFTMRETDVWQKFGTRWYSIHEHNSFPANPMTGQADLQSKP